MWLFFHCTCDNWYKERSCSGHCEMYFCKWGRLWLKQRLKDLKLAGAKGTIEGRDKSVDPNE